MRWSAPSIVGMLFSMRGGLLAWSPVVYLSLVGLWLGRRRLGALAVGGTVLFVLELYVNASVWDWWSSWSYGARRFCNLAVVFALGLGGLWVGVERRRLARRAVFVASALLVVGNVLMMELVRQRKTPSSSGVTLAAWERLEGLGAPRPVASLFRRMGWPFSWPAAAPFALYHRAPIRSFEEIYGAYLCYRDFWEHRVQDTGANFRGREGRRYWVSGLGEPNPKTGSPRVDGRAARLLLPLFRSEAMRVRLEGTFPPDRVRDIRWNRAPVAAHLDRADLVFDLDAGRVRHQINELDLPEGVELSAVRFEPMGAEPDFHGPPWHRH
jgi:hypothetical protein